MTDRGLLRRPVVPMAPPADGLEEVRREAGRRRRRRAVLSAAGGATVAAVAATAIVLAAEGNGIAVLKPRPMPPAAQPTPSVSAVPRPTPLVSRPANTPHSSPSRSLIAHHATTHHHNGQPVLVPQTRSSSAPSSQPSGPTSIRMHVYRSHGTMSGTQVCSGDVSNGQASVGNGLGWCRAISATKVAGGMRLRFTACRDDTRGGTLTYKSRREVDFAVRQNGKLIWDWAHYHPDSAGPHTRRAAANDCWNWELVWPDVKQTGDSAGRGQFVFVAKTTADELSGYPPMTSNFRY
jgi:hypothetical protein